MITNKWFVGLLQIFVFISGFSGMAFSHTLKVRTIDKSKSLFKYNIPYEKDKQAILVDEVIAGQSDSLKIVLVLDIERKYLINEPMDYTRLRCFSFNPLKKVSRLIYCQTEMAGATIANSKSFAPKIQNQYGTQYYFTVDSKRDGKPELIFAEWQYASDPGKITILKYYQNTFHVVFSGNEAIDWIDLNNDGVDEIVTHEWLQVGWISENSEVFEPPFITNKAYQYNGKQHKYLADEELTLKWVGICLENELKEYSLERKFDQGSFQHIIRCYLRLGQNVRALEFFNRDINQVLGNNNVKLTAEQIDKIRRELAGDVR